MARRRKTIKELIEEEQRLKEQLAKKRQRLQALRKRVREEYRKREASFLIGIGRTLLKYGKVFNSNGQKFICLPLNAEGFKEAFHHYNDVVEVNEDFAKWLKHLED